MVRRNNQWQSRAGFSLLELMVVLVIIGITAAFAAPSFQTWQHTRRLRQAATAVYSNMQLARSGSVRTGTEWALFFDAPNSRFYVFSDPGAIAGGAIAPGDWLSIADNLGADGLNPVLPIYLAGKFLDASGDGNVTIPPPLPDGALYTPDANDLYDVTNVNYGVGPAAPINLNPFVSVIRFYPNGTSNANGADYIYLNHCPDTENLASRANRDACGAATAPVFAVGVFNSGFPVIRRWNTTLNAGVGGWE